MPVSLTSATLIKARILEAPGGSVKPCYGADVAQGCRLCGSERIAPAVRVAPSAGPGTLLAQLRGRVCADCGYTELFAENPMPVFLAHQRESLSAGQAAPAAAANLQCPRCGSVIAAAERGCDACGWTQTGA